jgi:CheY-like chemotaxis protein
MNTTENHMASHSAGLQSWRVLVVDDNPDSADTLALLVQLLGAEVHIARSGPAALAELDAFHPGDVLLDIGMPGMDGYEVAQRIRAQPRFNTVRLIALTGWGQEEDRRRAHDSGFDHYLVKPVDLEALQVLLLRA